jgi:hypothetical protein
LCDPKRTNGHVVVQFRGHRGSHLAAQTDPTNVKTAVARNCAAIDHTPAPDRARTMANARASA